MSLPYPSREWYITIMLYYCVWGITVVVGTLVVFEDLMGRLKIYFLYCLLDVLEVCDNEKSV